MKYILKTVILHYICVTLLVKDKFVFLLKKFNLHVLADLSDAPELGQKESLEQEVPHLH